jgi:GNAT superfamily N-acetyltransferase
LKTVHELEIGVRPEEVWPGLTEPGRTSWYFNLTPSGEWRPGEKVEWRFSNGSVGEESTVVEVDPPHRLVLETRMLFEPRFAEDPPYRVAWELEPRPEGTLVRMTREFEDGRPTSRVLATESGNVLRGLRLAVDPAAQAELARLQSVGPIEVHDVTAGRVADYQRFFDLDAFRDYPAWQFCYCAEPIFSGDAEGWAGRTQEDNRRDIGRMLEAGETTGLLAYADGKPVGWCHYGRTTRLAGVMKHYELEPSSQARVGSIACFVISAPYRGHGVATALLEAACDRLAASGLEWVEAYPRKEQKSPQSNYRGPLAMYLAAGFRPYREAGPSLIVRKPLGR